jgi:hypothetical protein
MKIRPVKAELFHSGGRRDTRRDRHDKANVRFSHFKTVIILAGMEIKPQFHFYPAGNLVAFPPTSPVALVQCVSAELLFECSMQRQHTKLKLCSR